MRSNDLVGTLDQQTSQVGVASLRDAELRASVPGLTAAGAEAEKAPDIATLLETLLAAQGQHEPKSRKVTYAMDLQQRLCL